MRVILIGASRIGLALAKRLVAQGEEVILIDRDRERLEEIANQVDCGMLNGDGTDPEILRDALGESPAIVLSVTPEDQDNILACLLAISLGCERVIPRISRPQLFAICDELGLSERLSPEAEVAERLIERIHSNSDDISETLQWPARVFSMAVHENSDLKQVSDMVLPATARPACVYRGEQLFMAEPGQPLEPGDRVSIITDSEGVEELRERYGHGGG